MVASADPGTRPVPARASVMAAAKALLEYAKLITTANRFSGALAQPGKLKQSNWETAVGYGIIDNRSPSFLGSHHAIIFVILDYARFTAWTAC